MKARHVTSEPEYRSPFGAVQLGGTVSLSIDVWGDDVVFCTLRVWTDAHGEELIEMHGSLRGDCLRFSANYRPAETGVVWYSFDIEAKDGSVWRYGAKPGWTTGEGAFAYGDPPSFQITVYVPRAEQPRWYRDAVVYQIFPDRFARGEDWEERAKTLDRPRRGPGHRLVDWDKPVDYERTPEGGIAVWDFYGGTLEGIREKLEYLEDLGVTAIYLNPIFEASSNHRYDTADYLAIDPLLGTEQDFSALCVDAEDRGISVILDGVFNHSGQDSRYFNSYGNYPDLGAYQSPDSPYRDWYFFNEDGTYAGWWGNGDLPALNEDNPDYHELICGRRGVVRKWLRAGARGWRLDVADELSDEFIEDIKRALVTERPDGVLIGEVWEDASNKVSYGALREYFLGSELDATMHYPFRTAVLDFLLGKIHAQAACDAFWTIQEHYPKENLYAALNLIGSHDRARVLTVLGGDVNALKMAMFLQFALPGVPSIYYGDEAGMTGGTDPYNRGSFPWGKGNAPLTDFVRSLTAMYQETPLLRRGECEMVFFGENVLGCRRFDESGSVLALVNRGEEAVECFGVTVPGRGYILE